MRPSDNYAVVLILTHDEQREVQGAVVASKKAETAESKRARRNGDQIVLSDRGRSRISAGRYNCITRHAIYCNGDGIIHCCEGDRANELRADKWPLHQPK